MIRQFADLSLFLHDWYDVVQPRLALSDCSTPVPVAKPLLDIWGLVGRLTVGSDEWRRIGTRSPLACQDGFAAPQFVRETDGRVDFAFENQGNWSAGYRTDDLSPDPEILSNWIDMEERNAGYVRVGTKLSEFITTIILAETVFFGSESTPSTVMKAQKCDEVIWVGRYYNAVGFGGKYEKPSHRIRTNSERTLLALDWDSKFSGFVADRNLSRNRWEMIGSA